MVVCFCKHDMVGNFWHNVACILQFNPPPTTLVWTELILGFSFISFQYPPTPQPKFVFSKHPQLPKAQPLPAAASKVWAGRQWYCYFWCYFLKKSFPFSFFFPFFFLWFKLSFTKPFQNNLSLVLDIFLNRSYTIFSFCPLPHVSYFFFNSHTNFYFPDSQYTPPPQFPSHTHSPDT